MVFYIDPQNSIESIFQQYWKTETQYDFVYVSFVAHPLVDISLLQYQLIPSFLQKPVEKDQKSLSLVFHSSQEYDLDLKECADSILKQTSSNIDVWLVHTTISKQQLAELMFRLTHQLVQEKIAPQKCMICNYCCFTNPTDREQLFEQNMPLILQRCLDSYCNGEYADRLYQWFGTHLKNTVHLVYPYKNYKALHLRNWAIVEKYCRQTPIVGTINIHTFSTLSLEIELANDKNTTQSFKEFCKYCLDISSDSSKRGLVPYHLDYQYKVRNRLW